MSDDFVVIDGEKFRDFRRRGLGATQPEMSRVSGLSVPMIQTIERLGRHRMRAARFGELAVRFGVDADRLEMLLGTRDSMIWTAAVAKAPWVQALRAKIHTDDEPTEANNVRSHSRYDLPVEIPMFRMKVHASAWSEIEDNVQVGEWVSEAQVAQGRFRVQVEGECMRPRYRDGDTVEFLLLRTREGTPDFAAMREGKNYYVQTHEGATFKRFVRFEGGAMILRPTSSKHRGELRAALRDVVQIGLAQGTFDPE
jgi:DNA/RNA endonuclease YhcR with UshA esterase domain